SKRWPVPNCPPMARVAAAKVLLDRGWGKPKEMHHSEVDDNKPLLKVVNEIVHVYETREQIVQRPNPTVRDQPEQKCRGQSHAPRAFQEKIFCRRGAAALLPARRLVLHRWQPGR